MPPGKPLKPLQGFISISIISPNFRTKRPMFTGPDKIWTDFGMPPQDPLSPPF